MEKYDFSQHIDRQGTDAVKTDRLKEFFGREDLAAAWVADMDFASPVFVRDAIRRRLDHPVLGYTVEPADYRPAIIDWQRSLHGWEIKPEWLSYIPGIVKGIGMVVNVFTSPGDKVVIMPPVYHPFRIVPESNGREVVNVPLIEGPDSRYSMDFDALENVEGAKLLILSNPHNPRGQVWSQDELKRLADICYRKGITVISDEIHADMALGDRKHVPFATVSPEAAAISITFGAPTKTFNIPGVVSSFSIVPDKALRERFYGWLEANEFGDAPLFSYVATIAAYREGAEWRRQMLDYVKGNLDFVEEYFAENMPMVKPLRPEASYLVWVDFRKLGVSQDKLNDALVNVGKVALNDGAMFGPGGEGFMRLNVGAPRADILDILTRIKIAVDSLDR